MNSVVRLPRADNQRIVAQLIGDALEASGHGRRAANDALESCGLKVVIEGLPGNAKAKLRWLYVANYHRGIEKLFRHSLWEAGGEGVAPWVRSLRDAPGACAAGALRFAGYKSRTTKLPVDRYIPGPASVGELENIA
jgi:hypothetical protein